MLFVWPFGLVFDELSFLLEDWPVVDAVQYAT